MEIVNPYQIVAGNQLDTLIHHKVLRRPVHEHCPRYSTDDKAAEQLRKLLEDEYDITVSVGRTRIPSKPWYARYEIDRGNPTEVIAESLPLALCRLALLRARQQ